MPINRTERLSPEEYNISSGSFLGAPLKSFTRKDGKGAHSLLDNMFANYRPYNLAVTTIVTSPMKFFVYNQNRSAIIFGNNNEESVRNIVRFEIALRLIDFKSVLPIPNKPRLVDHIKITDFNNVISEK